jgi:uncharacterized protein (DUF433 family)
MNDQQLLERITFNPDVMVGKPVIKGTRLTVEYILNLVTHGTTSVEILAEYDGLTHEDVQACMLFAARALENTTSCHSSQRGYPHRIPMALQMEQGYDRAT